MPVLMNPKHERFAQALAAGKTQAEAQVAAGYALHDGNASRLSGDERIKARVAEILSKGAEGVAVTLASLLREAEEARRLAMDIDQPGAAIAAIKEKGVLTGLRVEKRENTHRSLNDLSDDELAAIATGSGEGVAAAPGRSPLPH